MIKLAYLEATDQREHGRTDFAGKFVRLVIGITSPLQIHGPDTYLRARQVHK